MKELLQTILTTTKERVSNPIIGTFIFSWIAFNWQPILLLFFSRKDIEHKISYISSNYNSINDLLIFPLIAVVIYILFIPYLNLFFEFLLEFARKKRNSIQIAKEIQTIENKKEIAIEEIKLEESQTEFRERKNHNKLIEDLQKSIIDKDSQLEIERERFNSLNKQIASESDFLNRRFKDDKKAFENKIELLLQENSSLKERLTQLTFSFHELQNDSEKLMNPNYYKSYKTVNEIVNKNKSENK